MNVAKNSHSESVSKLTNFVLRIKELTKTNGPSSIEHVNMTDLMKDIGIAKKEGHLSTEDIKNLQQTFGEAMTTAKTLQGMVCVKPHGYAGDFEIIDKIYRNHLSTDERFTKWDTYFQSQPAPQAVRNRKEFFKSWLASKPTPLRVLSLVGGPCRDILEYFEANPEADIRIDAVEYDAKAILFARALFREAKVSTNNISFINANIFKFTPEGKYDVIWCSGMFDYLDDKTFRMALRKLVPHLKPSGEMVIGNFHVDNPTKAYMDFGEWFLNYRTESQLIELALQSGVVREKVYVSKEDQGVNLFLHIKN